MINIVQDFGDFVKQNMTLFVNIDHIEMKLEIKSGILPRDAELVTRFRSQYFNTEFYSDNNGFQSFKRSFRNSTAEPISSNMYPMVYSFYARESKLQTTFITNRTIAAGILQTGQNEFMIQRRTIFDDGRGVAEPLYDIDYGYLGMSIHIDTHNKGLEAKQRMTYELNFPLESFTLTHQLPDLKSKYSFVNGDLPKNIHLVSLERKSLYSENKIFRLGHIFTDGEGSHPELSRPVNLNVENWLGKWNIEKFTSVSLSTVFNGINQHPNKVEIHPLQIRSFESKFSLKPTRDFYLQ